MSIQSQQYKIGELAQALNIKQFVIRFWEKEFKIKPKRSQGGHRYYTQHDLAKFNLIKELLYEKKFTLQGAKKELTTNKLKFNSTGSNIIPSHKTTLNQSENYNQSPDIIKLKENLKDLKEHLLRLRELL